MSWTLDWKQQKKANELKDRSIDILSFWQKKNEEKWKEAKKQFRKQSNIYVIVAPDRKERERMEHNMYF